MPSSFATHQLLSRFMIEKVLNDGELDFLDVLMAPDAITHEMEIFSSSAARGPETVRQFVEIFRWAFPDLKMTILDQLADGDRVTTRWRMEGTQSRRLMGIAPSHRPMSVEGIRIDRIADDRIAETWTQWDTIGMLRQLGALPVLERHPAEAPAGVRSSVAA
jgi:steroid delta-isomerase-like uncharacterized protein